MVFNISFEVVCKDLVDLRDEHTHFWNELDESFRNQENAVVFASSGSFANDISDLLGNIFESHVLGGDLLSDQAAVHARLQSTLKSDVGSRSTHQSHEVVVLPRGDGVSAEVSNGLGVDFGSRVETEADLDVLVFEVTINCLGTADDAAFRVVLGEVLCQEAGVRVRVITANDSESVKVKTVHSLQGGLKLLCRLDLVPS